MSIVLVLIGFGAIIGFGMHFLLPYKFSKIIVDVMAGVLGSAIGAIVVSPFGTPSDIWNKIVLLIGAILGAIITILVARALNI